MANRMAKARKRPAGKNGRKIYSVLITSAGVASGVNIIESLRYQSHRKVRIVAGDMNPLAPGLYLADSAHLLPPIKDPLYIENLLSICRDEGVDCLIPVFSREIEMISANLPRILRAGIKCIVPDLKTLAIVNDKLAFSQWTREANIPCPRDLEPIAANLPIYTKPRTGSSSKGARLVTTKEDLVAIKKDEHIFQEYVQGIEYTLDFLCDLEGELVAAVPRERLEVRDGKAIKSRTVYLPDAIAVLTRMTRRLGYKGPGNLQVIVGDGGLKVIELNPRFAAGGLTLSTASGPNMPLMLLEMLYNGTVRPHLEYTKDLFAVRYYSDIFLRKERDGFKKQ